MTGDEGEQIEQMIEEMTAKLLEYCQSVRVFVTWHDGSTSETKRHTDGGGNYYAQLGQAIEWVDMQRQTHRDEASKEDDE